MDRWKAEQGRGREKRKIRTENRRERVRRQKMQMREKVGKSRNTVFIQWFVAPEGRKVGGRRGTWRHGSSLCVAGVALMAAFGVAGVALGDMDLHFVWQVWHLATWILTLRGRRGTYGTGLALVAWYLVTWTFTLRGRRGTWRHGSSLCVAGVALMGLMALGWLWWRAWVSVDAVGAAAFGVAGVALGDMDLHFAWQVWHLATWTFTLRGKRGTYGTGLALVARLGLSWRRGRCGFWRGRRGTWWHGPSLCVAGVALALVALGWLWWRAWVSGVAVGAAAFCVAGVALGDMDLHFAWLTYNLLTHNLSTHNLLTHNLSTHRTCPRTHTHTTWHRRSLCVAGVALGDMDLHFAWQVWHLVTWYLSVFITPVPPLRSWKK